MVLHFNCINSLQWFFTKTLSWGFWQFFSTGTYAGIGIMCRVWKCNEKYHKKILMNDSFWSRLFVWSSDTTLANSCSLASCQLFLITCNVDYSYFCGMQIIYQLTLCYLEHICLEQLRSTSVPGTNIIPHYQGCAILMRHQDFCNR